MCPTSASSGAPLVPATRAIEEPRASVETSANAAAASRQTRAGALSWPEGPGVVSRSRSRLGISMNRRLYARRRAPAPAPRLGDHARRHALLRGADAAPAALRGHARALEDGGGRADGGVRRGHAGRVDRGGNAGRADRAEGG